MRTFIALWRLTICLIFLVGCGGYSPTESAPTPEVFEPVEAAQLPDDIPPATERPVEVQVTETPTPIPTFAVQEPVDLTSPSDSQITRSLIATRAAELAVSKMKGPYSWEEFRTCSTLVADYLRQLSFPVNGINGEYASYENPFPWSSVIEQTNWLRNNYPEYVNDAPLSEFLAGNLWGLIQPGDVIYLQSPLSHNGYDTYNHVVILIGYEDGSPIFAEMAAGMNSASAHRTYKEMIRGRYGPGDDEGLIVTWFDPLAILHDGKLWQNGGVVSLNSQKINTYFDIIITVNIYDGTTVIWEKVLDGSWSVVTLEGRDRFFAITGRLLPANKKITSAFMDERPNEIYDGDFGVYLSNNGIYQHSWTPQQVARIDGIEDIANFGGLNGSTQTTLPTPLVYDVWGNLVEYKNRTSFTIHRIPDVTSADINHRLKVLTPVNDPYSASYGPLPYPEGSLSSGCVNYDPASWKLIREFIKANLASDSVVGMIFSYPEFDQNLLPTIDLNEAAFTGSEFSVWCMHNERCDEMDRRHYRSNYLELLR